MRIRTICHSDEYRTSFLRPMHSSGNMFFESRQVDGWFEFTQKHFCIIVKSYKFQQKARSNSFSYLNIDDLLILTRRDHNEGNFVKDLKII